MKHLILLLPVAIVPLLLAASPPLTTFKARNGDVVEVNRVIDCFVQRGGIYCVRKDERGFATYINLKGVTVSQAESGKPVLICLHRQRCSG
jgi:hypothetical protein